jgi:hypothetical protein
MIPGAVMFMFLDAIHVHVHVNLFLAKATPFRANYGTSIGAVSLIRGCREQLRSRFRMQ